MTGNCTRCGKEDLQVVSILYVRPGGHSLFSDPPVASPYEAVSTCSNCITDEELARLLHPVANFVLSTLPRDGRFPEQTIALETVQAFFTVRNNNPGEYGRIAAIRAAGLSQ